MLKKKDLWTSPIPVTEYIVRYTLVQFEGSWSRDHTWIRSKNCKQNENTFKLTLHTLQILHPLLHGREATIITEHPWTFSPKIWFQYRHSLLSSTVQWWKEFRGTLRILRPPCPDVAESLQSSDLWAYAWSHHSKCGENNSSLDVHQQGWRSFMHTLVRPFFLNFLYPLVHHLLH